MKKLATPQNILDEEIRFPQEPLWSDTIDVIQKVSAQDVTVITSQDIGNLLRFNSIETRKRYGNIIYRRLLSDKRIGKTIFEMYNYMRSIR